MDNDYAAAIDVLDFLDDQERALLAELEASGPKRKQTAIDDERAQTSRGVRRDIQRLRALLERRDPSDPRVSRAVFLAIRVGLHAFDPMGGVEDETAGRRARERARIAGRTRGRRIATEAAQRAATMKRRESEFLRSEAARDDYRSLAAYIEAKDGIPRKTTQRWIRRRKQAATKSRQ